MKVVKVRTSNGGSISASITLSTDDGGVAGHERTESADACEGDSGEVHVELQGGVLWIRKDNKQ